MASIMTNVSANTALQVLSNTTKNLYRTQERISTGLRINTASDNAGYWAIAATMRSDVASFNAISDSLGLGLGMVRTAYEANEKIKEALVGIKEQVTNALNPAGDKAKYQAAIRQLQDNIKTYVNSASFSGANLLNGTVEEYDGSGGPVTAQPLQILASLVRSGSTVTPEYIVYNAWESHYHGNDGTSDTGFFNTQITAATITTDNELIDEGILGASFDVTDDGTGNAPTQAMLENMLLEVEAAIEKALDVGTKLGALEMRMENQQEFMASLIKSTQEGIGVLVDADMNEESSRLKALQVQQQLGIEALNIANAEPQNILALFR